MRDEDVPAARARRNRDAVDAGGVRCDTGARVALGELATLFAAFAALAAKDPVVVLARQRLVWKQPHPETAEAAKWLAGWTAVLVVCGIVLRGHLAAHRDRRDGPGRLPPSRRWPVAVNVKNRQRSTLFQIASAAALTSSSLATSLSATGTIPRWCWWLWLLLAMQATAGILVVHARLDARIAARGNHSRERSIPARGANRARLVLGLRGDRRCRAETLLDRVGAVDRGGRLLVRPSRATGSRRAPTSTETRRPARAGAIVVVCDPAYSRSLVKEEPC